jgi:hypothetical protein
MFVALNFSRSVLFSWNTFAPIVKPDEPHWQFVEKTIGQLSKPLLRCRKEVASQFFVQYIPDNKCTAG